MAPEESVEVADLLRSFERRFLAARALCLFPWQVGGGRGDRVRPGGLGDVPGKRESGQPGAQGHGHCTMVFMIL
jgi:hypothetical protein